MFWAIPAASLQKAGWALRFGLHLRSVLPSNKLEVGQAHQQVVGLPSHRYRGKRHFQGSIDYESLFFLVRYSAITRPWGYMLPPSREWRTKVEREA
jgi:hypothetical protein